MKATKIITTITTLSILLATLFALPLPASAAEQKINATEVTLYTVSEKYKDKVSIPDNYPQSFTFKVEGAKDVTIKPTVVTHNSLDISGATVKPLKRTLYYYNGSPVSTPIDGVEPDKITRSTVCGEFHATVIADGISYPVKVNVYDYTETYYRGVVKEYLDKNITSDMSTKDKLDVIARYVASKKYLADYHSFVTMMYYGGGSCWASTDTIVTMAETIGLRAWWRDANRSGHFNAMVTDGKSFYEVEAGYSAPAPRPYTIKVRTDLFSYRYSNKFESYEVLHYDDPNFSGKLIVPNKYNGKPIVSVAKYFLDHAETKEVVLPATIKNIAGYAFIDCANLNYVTIPPEVENIESGAIYNCPNLTIRGAKGSAAEHYAAENNIPFEEIEFESIGDINGDNSIDALDSVVIQKYSVNRLSLNDTQLKAADVNRDGDVDILDATDIQKYSTNKIKNFKKSA